MTLIHLFHMLLGAIWLGSALAHDVLAWTFEKSLDRLERVRVMRVLLGMIEMPLAILVPILGLSMTFMVPEFWREGWLHVKVTGYLILLLSMGLGMGRNRRLMDALLADDADAISRHWHRYVILRIVALLAIVVVFIAAFALAHPTEPILLR